MKKVLLGAVLSLAMVGCGVQTTPVINTNSAPDIHNIIASHGLTPLATTGSNLLTNGGFEEGLNAWTGCEAGILSKSSDAQAGLGAAAITTADNCFFQSGNVEVGKTYTLSCYIKETLDDGWTGLGFNFTDIDWGIIGEEVSVEAITDTYKKYSITREAPATTTYGTMWVYSSGLATIDSCELVEGGTVVPVAPVMPVTPVAPTPVTPVEPTPVAPMPTIDPTITPMHPTPVAPVMPVTPVTPIEPIPVAPVTPVEPISPVAPNSITDIAIGAGLNKLVAALKVTGLDSVLAQDAGGPYTVFAPSDEAFDTLLASLGLTFEQLAADIELTKQILLYHVIAYDLDLETLTEAQAMGDTRFETQQAAEDVDFGVFDGILYLDDLSGRKITASLTDVVASNGIVHVIDSVLLPPSVQDALDGSNH